MNTKKVSTRIVEQFKTTWNGLVAFNTLDMPHEAWLELRHLGVGGSDIGSILGLNKYASAFDVWLNKTYRDKPIEVNEAMNWGNVLEDPVALEFARVTGKKVARLNRMIQHKDGVLLANIDRRIVGESALLEVKTVGYNSMHLWGDSGTDEVPDKVLAQTLTYLAVTGYQKAYIACLIGGQELRIYEVYRDEEVIEDIVYKAAEFWKTVEDDCHPAPTEPSSVEVLYPENNDSFTVDAAIASTTSELKSLQIKIKEMQAEEKAIKAKLCARIGDTSGVKANEGDKKCLATWKSQTRKSFDTKSFEIDHPEMFNQYQKENSFRVLRVS